MQFLCLPPIIANEAHNEEITHAYSHTHTHTHKHTTVQSDRRIACVNTKQGSRAFQTQGGQTASTDAHKNNYDLQLPERFHCVMCDLECENIDTWFKHVKDKHFGGIELECVQSANQHGGVAMRNVRGRRGQQTTKQPKPRSKIKKRKVPQRLTRNKDKCAATEDVLAECAGPTLSGSSGTVHSPDASGIAGSCSNAESRKRVSCKGNQQQAAQPWRAIRAHLWQPDHDLEPTNSSRRPSQSGSARCEATTEWHTRSRLTMDQGKDFQVQSQGAATKTRRRQNADALHHELATGATSAQQIHANKASVAHSE